MLNTTDSFLDTRILFEREIKRIEEYYENLAKQVPATDKAAIANIKKLSEAHSKRLAELQKAEARYINNISNQLLNANNNDKILAIQNDLKERQKRYLAQFRETSNAAFYTLQDSLSKTPSLKAIAHTASDLKAMHETFYQERQNFYTERFEELRKYSAVYFPDPINGVAKNIMNLRHAVESLPYFLDYDPNKEPIPEHIKHKDKWSTIKISSLKPDLPTGDFSMSQGSGNRANQTGKSTKQIDDQKGTHSVLDPNTVVIGPVGPTSSTSAETEEDQDQTDDIEVTPDVQAKDWMSAAYYPYKDIKFGEPPQYSRIHPEYLNSRFAVGPFKTNAAMVRQRDKNGALVTTATKSTLLKRDPETRHQKKEHLDNSGRDTTFWSEKDLTAVIKLMMAEHANNITRDANGKFVSDSTKWGKVDISKINPQCLFIAYKELIALGVPASHIVCPTTPIPGFHTDKAFAEGIKEYTKRQSALTETYARNWRYKKVPTGTLVSEKDKYVPQTNKNAETEHREVAYKLAASGDIMTYLDPEDPYDHQFTEEGTKLLNPYLRSDAHGLIDKAKVKKMAKIADSKTPDKTSYIVEGKKLVEIFLFLHNPKPDNPKQAPEKINEHQREFFTNLSAEQQAALIINLPEKFHVGGGKIIDNLHSQLLRVYHNNRLEMLARILVAPDISREKRKNLYNAMNTKKTVGISPTLLGKIEENNILAFREALDNHTPAIDPAAMQRLVELYVDYNVRDSYEPNLFREVLKSKKLEAFLQNPALTIVHITKIFLHNPSDREKIFESLSENQQIALLANLNRLQVKGKDDIEITSDKAYQAFWKDTPRKTNQGTGTVYGTTTILKQKKQPAWWPSGLDFKDYQLMAVNFNNKLGDLKPLTKNTDTSIESFATIAMQAFSDSALPSDKAAVLSKFLETEVVVEKKVEENGLEETTYTIEPIIDNETKARILDQLLDPASDASDDSSDSASVSSDEFEEVRKNAAEALLNSLETKDKIDVIIESEQIDLYKLLKEGELTRLLDDSYFGSENRADFIEAAADDLNNNGDPNTISHWVDFFNNSRLPVSELATYLPKFNKEKDIFKALSSRQRQADLLAALQRPEAALEYIKFLYGKTVEAKTDSPEDKATREAPAKILEQLPDNRFQELIDSMIEVEGGKDDYLLRLRTLLATLLFISKKNSIRAEEIFTAIYAYTKEEHINSDFVTELYTHSLDTLIKFFNKLDFDDQVKIIMDAAKKPVLVLKEGEVPLKGGIPDLFDAFNVSSLANAQKIFDQLQPNMQTYCLTYMQNIELRNQFILHAFREKKDFTGADTIIGNILGGDADKINQFLNWLHQQPDTKVISDALLENLQNRPDVLAKMALATFNKEKVLEIFRNVNADETADVTKIAQILTELLQGLADRINTAAADSNPVHESFNFSKPVLDSIHDLFKADKHFQAAKELYDALPPAMKNKINQKVLNVAANDSDLKAFQCGYEKVNAHIIDDDAPPEDVAKGMSLK